MEEPQILSTFNDPPARRGRVLVFDACHVGVVLRAVLFVEAAVGVAVMFGAQGPFDWVSRLALASGSALPATLVWLLAACSLKRVLARLPAPAQHACGVGLGALAGLWGGAMLALADPGGPAPWLSTACAGALLSALLVAALEWRARGRTPADTAARLAELQARIRPHFLFNTLNTAVALVRQDPARAEAVLEDLADLFRQALADLGESVTLSEEVALARRYLAIEEVRFGERLRVEWVLDPRAGDARVPHLLLQPLVENAVKHGVEPSDCGAQVRVRTERRGDSVVIEVANTVPAGPGPQGNGLAQENVRRRLALLHDVRAQFRVTRREGSYQVRMEIPA
ncbi:sensor histidine kinase [Ramlibacter sp. MAHUQ-53]|uniref:sensor histidine kinase n=1 Tax=unclassified Ramlibacter TaxID=2617605 RepID=UPI003628E8A1